MPTGNEERRILGWWPAFVRDMFVAIGDALDGKPLDPNTAYDIEAPWPEHRIKITYISREDYAAERMEEPEGLYFVQISGPRFGGGYWEFRQDEMDLLINEALRKRPPPSG